MYQTLWNVRSFILFFNSDVDIFKESPGMQKVIWNIYIWQGALVFLHMLVEWDFYALMINKLLQNDKCVKLSPIILCASQMNAELVYSILKGVTLFSNVTFQTDSSEIANPDFFRVTVKEIVPKIVGSNCTVTFNKLRIKKKDWSNQDDVKEKNWKD